jgi:hypothetical protein
MFGTNAYARFAVCSAALCAAALAGCAEERTFFIVQNQVSTASDEGGCSGSTSETTYRPQGVLDVSAGHGYLMFPLLRLDVETSATTVEGPERNQFTLRHYRVSLDLGDIPGSFPAELTSFEHPTSGLLRPGSSLAGMVKVVPDALAQQLNLPQNARVMITAKLQAVAVRLGTDSELESTTFRYPIELCNGCLVRMANPCPDTVKVEEGTTAPKWESNACGLPQDTPVTCCDENGALRCMQGSSDGAT